jgi:hypothetical protein
LTTIDSNVLWSCHEKRGGKHNEERSKQKTR